MTAVQDRGDTHTRRDRRAEAGAAPLTRDVGVNVSLSSSSRSSSSCFGCYSRWYDLEPPARQTGVDHRRLPPPRALGACVPAAPLAPLRAPPRLPDADAAVAAGVDSAVVLEDDGSRALGGFTTETVDWVGLFQWDSQALLSRADLK